MASPPSRGGNGAPGSYSDAYTSHTNSSGGVGKSAATQLEFTQAMTDFKVMFPDMDAEVIEAVLRANNGAVDATIDHLLTMSADNEAEKAMHTQRDGATGQKTESEDNPPAYAGNPPSYQQATQEEEVDLINLGGACAGPLPAKIGFGESEILADLSIAPVNQLQTHQGLDIKQQGKTVDLLSDLDLATDSESFGAGARLNSGISTSTASQSAVPSSSPKLAYSHPSRQADHLESMSYPHSSPGSTDIRDNSSPGSSMIPTQQQLQEIYEENLRMREEAKTAFDHSPQALSANRGQESQLAASQRQQFLEDERFALMLQNEEFMAELRRDHEFMSALESEDSEKFRTEGGSSLPHVGSINSGSLPGAAAGSSALNRGKPTMMDEAVFREKLKTMGKTSKRKFAQLASMFSRKKGAKQLLGHAPAPSKDNLLLNAEPLVNDFDSEEESIAGGNKASSSESSTNRPQKTPTKGKYTSFS